MTLFWLAVDNLKVTVIILNPDQKVLDVKLLVPYISEYANSLTNKIKKLLCGFWLLAFVVYVMFVDCLD